MENRYAYSLNGSDWNGEYSSRKDARASAIDLAYRQTQPPGVIYVGKIVPHDPQTTHHAPTLIKEMRDRAGANYLTSLKPEIVRDLDQSLTQTLEAWLDRHQLRSTQFKVEAISEYPVPSPAAVQQQPTKEVSDLGPPRQVA